MVSDLTMEVWVWISHLICSFENQNPLKFKSALFVGLPNVMLMSHFVSCGSLLPCSYLTSHILVFIRPPLCPTRPRGHHYPALCRKTPPLLEPAWRHRRSNRHHLQHWMPALRGHCVPDLRRENPLWTSQHGLDRDQGFSKRVGRSPQLHFHRGGT